MTGLEHFWLFKPGSPVDQEDTEPVVEQPFTSFDQARESALSLGGNLDIFSTPATGGTWRFIEHVPLPTQE